MSVAGNHRRKVLGIHHETMSKPRGSFEMLWSNKDFSLKVLNLVWDEGQRIGKWGAFRLVFKGPVHRTKKKTETGLNRTD
jgi:hypothetical protein